MSLDSWGHGHDSRRANRHFWFTRIQNIPKLTPLKKEFTSRRKKRLREIYRVPPRRSTLYVYFVWIRYYRDLSGSKLCVSGIYRP